MTPEETIQQILCQNPKVSREVILQRLSLAKEKTGGLIADETLLRMIAAEFGVETPQENKHKHRVSFTHLVSGLNNVTVTGKVVAISAVRTFEGARSGKFASLTLVGKDGVLRVVLWNENADVVESGKLKAGQVARFRHGYTKQDRKGAVELHLSSRSEVEVEPADVKAEDYASISGFASKIKNLSPEGSFVNLEGTVKKAFPSSSFTRQDDSAGTVMRFVLADETGEVVVVVWNEKAQELEQALKVDAQVQLVNGRVKAVADGGVEVHVDASSYVQVSAVSKSLAKISSLNEFSGSVDVEGEVASVPVTREVTTSKGETVKLTVFELKDESAVVRVSAWRNHAEAAANLLMGEKVRLENAYAKQGYDGKLELSTRTATEFTKV